MNAAFKIIVFTLVLNFATGILLAVIPQFNTYGEYRMGLNYDSEYADGFTSTVGADIQPDSRLEDKGNAIYRILDMLNIGFIAKFLEAVDKYMFGFINLLEGIIGGFFTTTAAATIFGALKALMTIAYTYAAWALWTGKEITS